MLFFPAECDYHWTCREDSGGDIENSRQEIRREQRAVLAQLDPRWLRAASNDLCQRLTQFVDQPEMAGRSHILAWTAFFPGEVDLTSFISRQLGVRRLYLPRVASDASMHFLSVGEGWSQSLAAGAFGIPEPDGSGDSYDTKNADQTIVLVPGLAFDSDGNRLGRGRGHYDRFLGRPQMRAAVKVGICWSLQLIERVPTQSHDVELDFICHERGLTVAGRS